MQLRTCAALALAIVTLTACEGPPTVGQPTTFANVCDKANDGHRVAVQGVMRLPDTIRISRPARGGKGTEIVVVRLFETPAFNGTPIGVDIGFGSEPNTMDEIPSGAAGYTDADLKVHIAVGKRSRTGSPSRSLARSTSPWQASPTWSSSAA